MENENPETPNEENTPNEVPADQPEQPQQPAQQQVPQGCGCGTIIGFFVLLAAIIGLWNTIFGDSNDLDDAEVRTYCEIDVKDKLKSPSSANFSYPSVSETGEYSWTLFGKFEAQNSFGAMVANEYVCKVTNRDGNLRVSTIVN